MEVPRSSTSIGSYVAGALCGHVSRAWLVHAPYRDVILTWAALRKHAPGPCIPSYLWCIWYMPFVRSTYLSFYLHPSASPLFSFFSVVSCPRRCRFHSFLDSHSLFDRAVAPYLPLSRGTPELTLRSPSVRINTPW